MPRLKEQLIIDRCPYCSVNQPNLINKSTIKTHAFDGSGERIWKNYMCIRCGGLVLAVSNRDDGIVQAQYPESSIVDDAIPDPANNYLKQAIDSLHAPAGCVMLSASAVDAMLKSRGYKKGNLYTRIDKATDDHLITKEMAAWAHDVRLDANEPRHANEDSPLPSNEDAKMCISFILALGEFLFVLPSKVKRGIEKTTQ